MALEIITTFINGLVVVKPQVYFDERGYFLENYNQGIWYDKGLNMNFVQENQSLSQKGTLRGLHFQRPPYGQGKLVRVIQGKALDVVLDIRKGSPTYGQHYSVELTGENFLQLYVPEGFAHGFLTLEDDTIFSYKCTNFYNRDSEEGIAWDDDALQINWGISDPILSGKDKNNSNFKEFISPF